MLLLIFFAFLHCWLNAFAEMLRFGDRMFYRVRPGPGLAENCSWGGWPRAGGRGWLWWHAAVGATLQDHMSSVGLRVWGWC